MNEAATADLTREIRAIDADLERLRLSQYDAYQETLHQRRALLQRRAELLAKLEA